MNGDNETTQSETNGIQFISEVVFTSTQLIPVSYCS